MSMRWLTPIPRVEKEPVRANYKTRRHASSLARPVRNANYFVAERYAGAASLNSRVRERGPLRVDLKAVRIERGAIRFEREAIRLESRFDSNDTQFD